MSNQTGDRRRREGLVVFRQLLPQIREDVAAGWTIRAIYDKFGDQLHIKYRQFSRYVTRFLGDLRHEVRGETKPVRKATSAGAQPSAFRFDPTGAQSKKLV